MRTSSMSNGMLAAASRAGPPPPPPSSVSSQPPTQPQPIGSAAVGNPAALLKSQNAAAAAAAAAAANKMFGAMPMGAAAVGGGLGSAAANHRNTPPNAAAMPSSFPFQQPQQAAPQRPPGAAQRMAGFAQSAAADAGLNNENDFPSLRASPHNQASMAAAAMFAASQQQQQQYGAINMYAKEALMQQQQRMPYANLMRGGFNNDGSSGYGQTTEFTLQSEDFPALPGAQQQQFVQNALGGGGGGGGGTSASNQANSIESQLSGHHSAFGAQSNFYNATSNAVGSTMDFPTNGTNNENGRDPKSISVNTANGVVSNIPPGMLCDQYGIAGLLAFVQGLDNYPALRTLSIGLDFSKLGLNMGSPVPLYETFAGPWSEPSCRLQETEVKVPDEYLTNHLIRDRLPPIKVNKLTDDILFYMFYNCPGQVYQLAAASELYQRDWRYHKADGVWMTRMLYAPMKEQTAEYEKGTYNIFDPVQWRKVPKEMTLEYKMLEARPGPTPALGGHNFANSSNGNVTTPGQQQQLTATTPFLGAQQQPTNAAHFSLRNL